MNSKTLLSLIEQIKSLLSVFFLVLHLFLSLKVSTIIGHVMSADDSTISYLCQETEAFNEPVKLSATTFNDLTSLSD